MKSLWPTHCDLLPVLEQQLKISQQIPRDTETTGYSEDMLPATICINRLGALMFQHMPIYIDEKCWEAFIVKTIKTKF